MTPPPTIKTDLAMRLRGNPPAKGIGRIENESGLGINESTALDRGNYFVPRERDTALKDAAHDALLAPNLAGLELLVCIEAGELRAGAGPAGRAIVSLAGAQHEVSRVASRCCCRAEEFHMINFREALLVDRLPQLPAIVGKSVHVPKLQCQSVILHKEKPITSPGNIAGDLANGWHIDRNGFGLAVAWD